jgi:kynurenine formamidase
MTLPKYQDLPQAGSHRQRSAWGVFGANDVLGRLNLITPATRLSALAELTTGQAIPLSWQIDKPNPAILGRQDLTHRAFRVPDGWDDVINNFCPQGSTQWDALTHCRHPELGYYNGFLSPDEHEGGSHIRSQLGMHNYARETICSRFVLADMPRWAAANHFPYTPESGHQIDERQLAEILQAQDGTQLRPGDILMLRTGWIDWYETLDPAQRQQLAPPGTPQAAGLKNSTDILEYLWDAGVAAIIADNPSVEAMPFDTTRADGFLHYQLIPLLGFALGELFDLHELAQACATIRRWSGLLCAAPMDLPGAVGSPGNAIALL